MKLSEIKSILNNKNYLVRSEFMREYHFEDNNLSYYRKFILDNIHSKNCMFLTDLIYLASKINFKNSVLQNIFKGLLLNDSRYLVKLAVLDYWAELDPIYLPKLYGDTLLNALKMRNFRIVKNQLYFNLFILNSPSINFYFNSLTESLKHTKDWRSIYRTLRNFKDVYSIQFLGYKRKIFNQIKKLNNEQKMGDGVDEILNSFPI